MPEGPSFDLITTTLGRVSELSRLLDSLAAQTHRQFRLILVDQNPDGRIDGVVGAAWNFPILRLRSPVGLSRGRNRALGEVSADVVGFPDDDCRYPPGLLREVATRLVAAPELDGVTGRLIDFEGLPEPGSWRDGAGSLDLDNVWSSGVSATMFLRTPVVRETGSFDVRLGLGSDAGTRSGEETDYLVRALAHGARLYHEPQLVVEHRSSLETERFSTRRGLRDGQSLGYILRKNRLPPRIVARMLARPFGAIPVRIAQGDLRGARFQAATLAGRAGGLVLTPRGRRAGRRPSA